MAGEYNNRSLYYLISFLLLLPLMSGSVTLSYDYYRDSCPELEVIVRKALLPIFLTDPRSAAGFLRLFFHDCQVQGCDASILLNNDNSEMASSKNFGIRNRHSISEIKYIVEKVCPDRVSCADILALAARDSVAHSGGPYIEIPLGRKDSVSSSADMADKKLPSATLGLDGSLALFLAQGMTIEESVAILGGHTLGAGHCINILKRLHHDNKIDYGFKALLKLKCPFDPPLTNITLMFNDLISIAFDNQYYRDVISGRGLFTVDSEIASDPRTLPIVMRFSVDQEYFFGVFSSAFVKLSSVVGPVGDGQIRRHCDRVN